MIVGNYFTITSIHIKFFYLGQEKGGLLTAMAICLKLAVFLVSLFVCSQVDVTNARPKLYSYSYLQRLHEALMDKPQPLRAPFQESRAHNMRQQQEVDGFEIAPGMRTIFHFCIVINQEEQLVNQVTHQ